MGLGTARSFLALSIVSIDPRITLRMARPPWPPPADGCSNSVHLWRRNRDGNEDMHRQINDEARRIAVNIAKSRSYSGDDLDMRPLSPGYCATSIFKSGRPRGTQKSNDEIHA